MKSILAIGLLSIFMVSCSSSKKEMTTTTDQTVKATEAVKTEATKAAEKATMPSANNLMTAECKLGKDMRVISIDKNGTNGCLVNYTKNGETKQVARSQVGQTYCTEVGNRIKSNLANAGFACQ